MPGIRIGILCYLLFRSIILLDLMKGIKDMERLISVRVRVNDILHANIIKDEIEEVIKNRTTIWHISDPVIDSMTIEEVYKIQQANEPAAR